MAGQVVQMDYEVINNVAGGFEAAEAMTIGIGAITQTTIFTLIAMSGPFASLFIGPKLLQINATVQQKCKDLEKMCEEFSGDLKLAVKAHQNGDTAGGKFFQQGLKLRGG